MNKQHSTITTSSGLVAKNAPWPETAGADHRPIAGALQRGAMLVPPFILQLIKETWLMALPHAFGDIITHQPLLFLPKAEKL